MTSYSSQSQTVDRVLVNADAQESDLLLNQRMGYVAVSRAREDAMIFTSSSDELRAALDRNLDKEMAVETLRQSSARDASYHSVSLLLIYFFISCIAAVCKFGLTFSCCCLSWLF